MNERSDYEFLTEAASIVMTENGETKVCGGDGERAAERGCECEQWSC